MPVRTHERRQASRGGLDGSDASGGPLLPLRDKAWRRRGKARKDRRRRLRFSKTRRFADEPGGATRRRTEVAFVRTTIVVVPAAIRVTVATRMVMRHGRLVLLSVAGGARLFVVVVVTVLRQLSLSLDSRPGPGARHGGRERSPNGKKHCKQQQQPRTKQLHVWLGRARQKSSPAGISDSMNLAPRARSSQPRNKEILDPPMMERLIVPSSTQKGAFDGHLPSP